MKMKRTLVTALTVTTLAAIGAGLRMLQMWIKQIQK